MTVEEKYGINNHDYRILKEYVVLKVDIALLTIKRFKKIDEGREMDLMSDTFSKNSDELDEILYSINKKTNRIDELMKEISNISILNEMSVVDMGSEVNDISITPSIQIKTSDDEVLVLNILHNLDLSVDIL